MTGGRRNSAKKLQSLLAGASTLAILLAAGAIMSAATMPALAACDNSTPPSGNTVTCDASPPNPDTTPIVAPGSTGVTVHIFPDAVLQTPSSPAIHLGGGAFINMRGNDGPGDRPLVTDIDPAAIPLIIGNVIAGDFIGVVTRQDFVDLHDDIRALGPVAATPAGATIELGVTGNTATQDGILAITAAVTTRKAQIADRVMATINDYLANDPINDTAPPVTFGPPPVPSDANVVVLDRSAIVSAGAAGIRSAGESAMHVLLSDGSTLATVTENAPAILLDGAGALFVTVDDSTIATFADGAAGIATGGNNTALAVQLTNGGSISTAGDNAAAIVAPGSSSVTMFEARGPAGTNGLPMLSTFGDNSAGFLAHGTGASTLTFQIFDAAATAFGPAFQTNGNNSTLFDVYLGGNSSTSFVGVNSSFGTFGNDSGVISVQQGASSDWVIFLYGSILESSGNNAALIDTVTANDSLGNLVAIDTSFHTTGDGSRGIVVPGAHAFSAQTTFLGDVTITTEGADATGLVWNGAKQGSVATLTVRDGVVSTLGDGSAGMSIDAAALDGSASQVTMNGVTVTTEGASALGIYAPAGASGSSAHSMSINNTTVTTKGENSTALVFGGSAIDSSVASVSVLNTTLATEGDNSVGLLMIEGTSVDNSVLITSLGNVTVSTLGANSHGIVLGAGLGTEGPGLTDNTFVMTGIAATTSGANAHALVLSENTTLSLTGQSHVGATTANGTTVNGTIDSFDGFVATGAGSRAVMNHGILYGTFTVGAAVTGNLANNGLIESASGAGGVAVQFTGATNDIFELQTQGVVIGTVEAGAGTDTFILGGTGTASFAPSLIGTQYLDFELFRKEGDSVWTLTGPNLLKWSVAGGELVLAGATGDIGETPFVVEGPARVTVAASGSITTTAAASPAVELQHAGASVVVNGTIVATNSDGVAGIAGGTLIVGTTGSLTGALTGATFSGGPANVIVAGTVIGQGGTAVQFDDFNNTFELRPGFSVSGTVEGGTATDTFVFGGTGTAGFDVALIGTQYNGFDAFEKTGASVWTLTGTNTSAAPFLVSEGTLVNNATLANMAMTVAPGARLEGIGTVGSLVLNGTLAPGNSVGTMTVAGNAAFNSGSTYVVEINGGGNAPGVNNDLVVADTATIQGGAIFHVVPENGTDDGTTYAPNTQYTVIRTAAPGGLTVTGTQTVTDSFAFLSFTGHGDGQYYYLTSSAAAVSFCLPGASFNQCQTGEAVRELGPGNPVFDAVLGMSEPAANAAFNALSGEIHASLKGAILQSWRYLRNTLTSRLRSAETDGGPQLLAYAPGINVHAPAGADGAIWMQAQGSWGRIDGDGNAASMGSKLGGLFAGVDRSFGGWRVGFAGGYTANALDVSGRGSSASVKTFQLAAYAGKQHGPVGIRIGAMAAHHDIDAARSIAIPALAQNLRADYSGASAQVFGEVGYALHYGSLALEPFAGLALAHLRTGGFTEQGGNAALSAGGSSDTVAYSTLGVRAAHEIAFAGAPLVLHGTLAWRHAFGDVTPGQTLSFAAGTPFSVAGVPIARNTALIEAGITRQVADRVAFDLSYSGEVASRARDHSFRARLTGSF